MKGKGLIDDSTWSEKLAGIERIYNICVGREIYDSRAPIFYEEFRQVIESFSDECANQ